MVISLEQISKCGLMVASPPLMKSAKEIGLPMSELITHKFPLEEINEALKTNLAMSGLKIAIVNK